MTAARQDAQERAQGGSAQHGRHDAAQVVAARHEPADAPHGDVAIVLVLEVAQDLGDAEHADRDGDEIEPVGELELAEREPLGARVDVGADQPEKQPEHDHRERLEDGAVGERDR